MGGQCTFIVGITYLGSGKILNAIYSNVALQYIMSISTSMPAWENYANTACVYRYFKLQCVYVAFSL